jgi:hypothetical protein
VCQAAACATAGRETDCDGVVAGRTATVETYRVRRARGIGVLSLGWGGGVYDEFKEEWESVSKIVVIAREGMSAFPSIAFMSRMIADVTVHSCEYGKREAVGGCAAALVRPANR